MVLLAPLGPEGQLVGRVYLIGVLLVDDRFPPVSVRLRPVGFKSAEDGNILRPIPQRAIKPDLVAHDPTADVAALIPSIIQLVSAGDALSLQRGTHVVALKPRAGAGKLRTTVEVVPA